MNAFDLKAKTARRPAMTTLASGVALIVGLDHAAAQEATPLPPISIASDRAEPAAEGSEAAGYKPSKVSNLGPFGAKAILDTPYSVNVLSADLLENLQAWKPDDIFKVSPVIQLRTTTARGASPNFKIRGFAFANSSGRAEDGLRTQNLAIIPLEDKERVEIYTGLTSFLYGPNNVGGLMNYVYKRPTDKPLADVTIGNYGGLSPYLHGDFGGPIDKDGQFSYRLNIVGQTGDAPVDQQSVKRDVLTAALAWRPVQDMSFTFIASHMDFDVRGADPFWNFATNSDGSSKVRHPGAPDPTKYYGQPLSAFDTQRDRVGLDFKWKIDDVFTARAAYSYNIDMTRNNFYTNNSVSNLNLTYSQTTAHNSNSREFGNSGYAFVDAIFDTGFIHHKVTAGFYGDDYRSVRDPESFNSWTINGLPYATPLYFAAPGWYSSTVGPNRTSGYNNEKNVILGDEIKFDDHWSLLVGGNYTWVHGTNFNVTTGAVTSAYDQSRLSPSASLIFKPLDWISTYATYSESLQGGQVVPSSGTPVYTNGGQTLPPYVGREYEIGAKADVDGLLLTAAFFQIEQALQYARYNGNSTYTYVQDGRQRNRGVELTVTGNLYEGLRIFGGVTLLDPRVTQSNTSATAPTINGKVPTDIARTEGKVTLEYDLPFLPGVTLTGGYYFTGQQAVDRLNTEYLPSFATEDVGFRYRTSEFFGRKLPLGQELVLRFNVSNVANKAYWIASNYVGSPRTFAVSAQLKF
ncbi:MAG TPA: TonB-dependent receptor [Methylosinus sp.]|jgi:iron complex outermembrane receptor protein|uniref:TonB-dependent receptor n=1 Tax=Methylosinus sp. TaxID=427 RepID=UPI002F92F9A4